jgi:peptidoglycan/xylan/chitin deacetylase (PgdA/CDA1 family)
VTHDGTRARGRTIAVTAAALLLVSCGSGRKHVPHARSTVAGSATTRRSVPPTTQGPPPVPKSLLGKEWTRLPTTQRIVALTFDAGGNDAGVPAILSTLDSTGTPATFFMTGHWAHYYPSVARRIAAHHPVGDHTWTHPDLTALSDAQVREQVLMGAKLIHAATGTDTRPLFRFPYGARDARTIGLINALGYASIRWTVDTLGWMGTSGGQSVQSVVSRALSNLQPGEIVLMHVGSNPQDNSTLDASALPTIIHDIRQRGYRFVTVTQFIRSLPVPSG